MTKTPKIHDLTIAKFTLDLIARSYNTKFIQLHPQGSFRFITEFLLLDFAKRKILIIARMYLCMRRFISVPYKKNKKIINVDSAHQNLG